MRHHTPPRTCLKIQTFTSRRLTSIVYRPAKPTFLCSQQQIWCEYFFAYQFFLTTAFFVLRHSFLCQTTPSSPHHLSNRANIHFGPTIPCDSIGKIYRLLLAWPRKTRILPFCVCPIECSRLNRRWQALEWQEGPSWDQIPRGRCCCNRHGL